LAVLFQTQAKKS